MRKIESALRRNVENDGDEDGDDERPGEGQGVEDREDQPADGRDGEEAGRGPRPVPRETISAQPRIVVPASAGGARRGR